MAMKTSGQIRQDFFEFFRKKVHVITSSAPVVPQNDPTLLFTNAGMNQFKSIFLGDEDGFQAEGKIWNRAANTQRCIRVSGKHNDLEEVGHDTYHHTLFEMLGNWSFGDYFKEEAIKWAWELLVDEWGLEPDRLYATVFGGDEEDGLPPDEEAAKLWEKCTSINPDNILKYGKKDNFWEMGETGPCGPCSEVHIDLRPEEDRKKLNGAMLVNADDPRVMEIWNLVFIQFNRLKDGSLKSLPAKHVDTGMGFERICAVIQGKTSNYDSDVFTPLIGELSKLSGIPYGKHIESDIAMRVIADHIRAVSFGIADGASPSNDGRGYVIRRILRRAIRYGWDKLNLKKPFMHSLTEVLADQFVDVFPELHAQLDYVRSVIKSEEESFLKTLGQGIHLFNQMAEGKKTISGDDAFKLHDTYGFPIDLTNLMARERGLKVDEDRFQELMNDQKDRARKAGAFSVDYSEKAEWTDIITDGHKTETRFLGYDQTESDVRIVAVRKDKKGWQVILNQTPFYAESGGQVADTGIITGGGEILNVSDVRKIDGKYVHFTNAVPESPDGVFKAQVDSERRTETRKHHTATHLLHAALREILGNHVGQKGSLVNDQKLRFDFSHYEALSDEQLEKIEARVNEKIRENIPLKEERDVPIDEARSRGAMMLFGEKYGEYVRMITFDPEYSVELCGGTHVNQTGEIGYFRLTAESSVAAGIRRVEAVAGKPADAYLRSEKKQLKRISEIVGQNDDIAGFIEDLIREKKNLEKELEKVALQASQDKLKNILGNISEVDGGVKFASGIIDGADMNQLKQLGYDSLNHQPENLVTLIGSVDNDSGKVYLVTTVTDDLIKSKGLKAGSLVGKFARIVGGGGGGQPNLATAGGKKPEMINELLEKASSVISEEISGLS